MTPAKKPQAKPEVEAGKTVRVTPVGSFQVGYAGKVIGPGDSLEVPEDVARRWELSGIATLVEE